MVEWQVQQNRKTAICIDGEAWCLVGKQYTATKEVRYLLNPWPELLKEIPGRKIKYDEQYVKARDLEERKRKIESGIGPFLYHLRALIGFLPSRLKSRIELNLGVPSRNATFLSLIIELIVSFVLGALLQIAVYGSLRAPELAAYIPILILLTSITFLDLVMRYHSYLREDASPWGLFEWIIYRKKPTS